MTRTSRARIRPFTRICDCRLNQSSWPATREVNRGAVFIFPHQPETIAGRRHFCLIAPADAAMTSPLFASRLEVVNNIRPLARLICLSGRDERFSADDVQQGNFIETLWNIFGWIGHRTSHQQECARQECHLGMLHVQVSAITGINTERNKWAPRQQSLDLFWVHIWILSKLGQFSISIQAGGGSPKCAACAA